MASPGALMNSESYTSRTDMILEATPQSPGIGEAVLSGKSLPVDIPTNTAPTIVQGWVEIAQQSMNEMDMRMSLSRSRSHHSAFSASSRGRAVSVSTPDGDTPQNHVANWQQQHQQPHLQHGGRTGAPRVLRFPVNSQSSSAHAPMSGSNHLRRRHSMTADQGEVGGEEVAGSSIGGSSRHVVVPSDVYATPGREQADELRDEDDYGRPLQLEWPHWNRYDAYSPPTTRASMISSGGGGGLSARAVSRCGSSGGEASIRPASMSSVSNRGMPGSVPSSYASELVFSVKGTQEEGETEAGGARSAPKSFGERGDDSDHSEDRDAEDAQDDVEGAVFDFEL